ncbi:MAG TPA: hypothetical protein VIP11_23020 [Gemmatimonadaceae bacterium]
MSRGIWVDQLLSALTGGLQGVALQQQAQRELDDRAARLRGEDEDRKLRRLTTLPQLRSQGFVPNESRETMTIAAPPMPVQTTPSGFSSGDDRIKTLNAPRVPSSRAPSLPDVDLGVPDPRRYRPSGVEGFSYDTEDNPTARENAAKMRQVRAYIGAGLSTQQALAAIENPSLADNLMPKPKPAPTYHSVRQKDGSYLEINDHDPSDVRQPTFGGKPITGYETPRTPREDPDAASDRIAERQRIVGWRTLYSRTLERLQQPTKGEMGVTIPGKSYDEAREAAQREADEVYGPLVGGRGSRGGGASGLTSLTPAQREVVDAAVRRIRAGQATLQHAEESFAAQPNVLDAIRAALGGSR